MVFMRSALALVVLAAFAKLSLASEEVVKLSLGREVCRSCSADASLSLLQGHSLPMKGRSKSVTGAGARDEDDSSNSSKVLFLKTHYTGSSTLSGILRRYCYFHHQTCSPHLSLTDGHVPASTVIDYLREHGNRDHVQIWDGHVEYHREAFDVIMPGATIVSLFREPMSRIIAGFSHERISTETVRSLLEDLMANQSRSALCHAMNSQVTSFPDVDWVLMTEDYDRSLVLMAMKLGWDLKDLLYVNVRESPDLTPERQQAVYELKAYIQQPLSALPLQARDFAKVCLHDDVEMYNKAQRTYYKQLAALTPHQLAEVERRVARLQEASQALSACCEEALSANQNDPYCDVVLGQDAFTDFPSGVRESHCRHKALKAIRPSGVGRESVSMEIE